MKINKYRPNSFSGFDDVYYEVNSKEELLASELCKWSIGKGFEISFSIDEKEDEGNCQGEIMAIKQADNKYGAEWWVLAVIHNKKDIETLEGWLPSWEKLAEKYRILHNEIAKL